MKILSVILDLEKGGAQRAAQNFALGYKHLGHDSRVLYTRHSNETVNHRGKILRKNKIKLYSLNNNQHRKLLKRWKPNLVHLHAHGITKNNFACIKKIIPHATYVETNVFSTLSGWSEEILYSFQLSHWSQWLYYLRGGKNDKNICLPYPVHTKSFSRASKDKILKFRSHYNIPHNAFVIGRVGQSIPTKWSYTIISLFNSIACTKKNVYLVLINTSKDIIRLAKKSRYSQRIIIINSIYGDDNLSIAYSSFNVVYLAADQGESFGMVIPEAILCGTPVISLATPWGDNSQCEVTRNKVGGYVINNYKNGISIINKMIGTKNINNFVLKKGIKHIIKNYDYINVSKQVVNLLKLKKNNTYNNNLQNINVVKILKNAFDKPNFFTVILLKLKLRFLTRYSSGYDNWINFFRRVYIKIYKIFDLKKT